METLEWCGRHPIMTVLAMWCAAKFAAVIYTRSLRLIMVSARGWPPAHLDADGDWKPEAEKSS